MTDTAVPNIESDRIAITPLDALHRRLGGRMTPFAATWLPVHYPAGIMAEHRACREGAALFDVSHMGQVSLRGDGAAAALERLAPADITGLPIGRQCYTLLLNEMGGIFDDLMVARYPDRLTLVVNANRKQDDLRHLAADLPDAVRLEAHEDRALLALQGPGAEAALAALAPGCAAMRFMDVAEMMVDGSRCWVARSGYTGEDGFEISAPAAGAMRLAERLLAQPGVSPAGLGARDTLRLEAGLPLYGADIDELTTPVEAAMAWTVARRRRETGGYLGAVPVGDQLRHGAPRVRVGLRPEGRAPARAGTQILSEDGTEAGTVTSGGFSPTGNMPVAMGYVRKDQAAPGTRVRLLVRGQSLPAVVCVLPFVAHRYRR